jgi:hypothetical protein
MVDVAVGEALYTHTSPNVLQMECGHTHTHASSIHYWSRSRRQSESERQSGADAPDGGGVVAHEALVVELAGEVGLDHRLPQDVREVDGQPEACRKARRQGGVDKEKKGGFGRWVGGLDSFMCLVIGNSDLATSALSASCLMI